MNESVKTFIEKEKEKKQKELQERKNRFCIKLGLVDEYKKYYDNEVLTPNGARVDPVLKKYYTIENIPIEITDEEYEELLEYYSEPPKPVESNNTATFLLVIAVSMLVGGFITSLCLFASSFNGYAIASLISGIVFFSLFLSLYEIINLINKNASK